MKRFFIKCLATFFYSGMLPKMPGTWGSLAALPFAWYLWMLPNGVAWIVFGLAVVLSIWVAHEFDRMHGGHDNQSIVIDEVMGIFLTSSVAAHTWQQYLIVFLLFRLFDVWKPFPVRLLDRKVSGGLGVVVDDLAAAGYALVLLFLINKFYLNH